MVAHSGGPPLAMYLLPLGLGKHVYAGTTSMFFTVGNLIKAAPWLALGASGRRHLGVDGDKPPRRSLWRLARLAPACQVGPTPDVPGVLWLAGDYGDEVAVGRSVGVATLMPGSSGHGFAER